jgi:2-oxoglutarate ferredoxin oxidoreductase subunit alpha
VFSADITAMTLRAVESLGLNNRAAVRCKNFFALGLVYWLYNRDPQHTVEYIETKFKDPTLREANLRALKAGYNFGETAELFDRSYEVREAKIEKGRYRNISGNEALSLGFLAAAELSGLDLFLGSYPITPASDILHALAAHKNLGVRTFQAEDEIAAICASIGAAYSGALALTTTSGPGLALKGEAMGLALMLELPLVIVDVQRAGPSTGMPTKTEQSDLMQAMFGRNGEAPLPIIAASSPGDCFHTAIEACRMAVTHMIPVVLLSDGYIANSSEPWPVPDMASIPRIPVKFRTDKEGFQPYSRDEYLARPWALPGTPGLEHRIGGIEKADGSGTISYDPANHDHMVRTRAAKVAGITVPPLAVDDPTGDADLLLLGWGSTFGPITGAVRALRARGILVAQAHLRHLNPLPTNTEQVLRAYSRVVVPEMNLGQLALILRGLFLVDAISVNQVRGLPFRIDELVEAVLSIRAGSYRRPPVGTAGAMGTSFAGSEV